MEKVFIIDILIYNVTNFEAEKKPAQKFHFINREKSLEKLLPIVFSDLWVCASHKQFLTPSFGWWKKFFRALKHQQQSQILKKKLYGKEN